MSNAAGARPTGVTVISVLSIIGGVLTVIAGIGSMLIGGAISSIAAGAAGGAAVGGAFGLIGIIGLALGVLGIVVGISFFGMKPWAWTAMAVITVLNIVTGLMGPNILGIVISGVILYYLFTKPIKKLYGATFGPSF